MFKSASQARSLQPTGELVIETVIKMTLIESQHLLARRRFPTNRVDYVYRAHYTLVFDQIEAVSVKVLTQ